MGSGVGMFSVKYGCCRWIDEYLLSMVGCGSGECLNGSKWMGSVTKHKSLLFPSLNCSPTPSFRAVNDRETVKLDSSFRQGTLGRNALLGHGLTV